MFSLVGQGSSVGIHGQYTTYVSSVLSFSQGRDWLSEITCWLTPCTFHQLLTSRACNLPAVSYSQAHMRVWDYIQAWTDYDIYIRSMYHSIFHIWICWYQPKSGESINQQTVPIYPLNGNCIHDTLNLQIIYDLKILLPHENHDYIWPLSTAEQRS